MARFGTYLSPNGLPDNSKAVNIEYLIGDPEESFRVLWHYCHSHVGFSDFDHYYSILQDRP